MARRKRRKKLTWWEKEVETLAPEGEGIVAAPCPLQRTCGGCRWQTFSPELQLELKRRFIERCFEDVGLTLEVPAPLPAPEPFHYRNRMEFTFTERRFATLSLIHI